MWVLIAAYVAGTLVGNLLGSWWNVTYGPGRPFLVKLFAAHPWIRIALIVLAILLCVFAVYKAWKLDRKARYLGYFR
jgi:hypothetical protein